MGYSPPMRVKVLLQSLSPAELAFRVCEADGGVAARWLPLGPLEGPLDGGGFDSYPDARAFALGVDLIRGEAGLLGPQVRRAIATERAELDADQRGRRRPALAAFEAA